MGRAVHHCRLAEHRSRLVKLDLHMHLQALRHQVINRSAEPARVLILSSKAPLAVVHYPDSAKVGLWSQGEGYQTLLKSEPKLEYWDGET